MSTVAVVAFFLGLVAVLGSGTARAVVPTDPPTFSDPLDIDNAYHPFVEFRLRLYEVQQGHADGYAIDVFSPETRTFMVDGNPVECACMEEWAIEEGEVVEISKNYFAQADDGTVYYFGEVVDNYEDGVIVDHDGSWLVGGPVAGDPVDTATADEPAVFMPDNPEVGDVWKPEDLPDDDIEEFVTALQFQKKLQTPLDKLEDVLEVEEETPDIERKWYAAGVGFAKAREQGEILIITDLVDAADEDDMMDELDAILDELLEEEE
jgi:hypothetical protein